MSKKGLDAFWEERGIGGSYWAQQVGMQPLNWNVLDLKCQRQQVRDEQQGKIPDQTQFILPFCPCATGLFGVPGASWAWAQPGGTMNLPDPCAAGLSDTYREQGPWAHRAMVSPCS